MTTRYTPDGTPLPAQPLLDAIQERIDVLWQMTRGRAKPIEIQLPPEQFREFLGVLSATGALVPAEDLSQFAATPVRCKPGLAGIRIIAEFV